MKRLVTRLIVVPLSTLLLVAVTFDLNGRHAADCRLPVATPSYHHWNLADIGTLEFPAAGRQLLTFHYGRGNNFAWFEFLPAEPPPRD